MKSNESHLLWNGKARPPALVLLTASEGDGLWLDAAKNLIAELRQRMPGVAVSSASTAGSRDLQSALDAVAFLGAPSAIVVRLFGQEPNLIVRAASDVNPPKFEMHRSEALPDIEAIVTSYKAALLAIAPDEDFLPCN